VDKDTLASHDLISEIIALANASVVFTDIHIEQEAPIMVRTPRAWQVINTEPVSLEDMLPLLKAIDEDWEDKIILGALDRAFDLTQCRLRCNIFRVSSGAKVVVTIRRLPLYPMSLDKIGVPQYTRVMLEATKGIILVTGATGSGKTTTMASMLDYFNSSRNSHIVTIEEPIEYQHQRKQSIISQKEVPTDTPSFSSGLKEALRQKPDILMVGEIRDLETADTVLQAGESGHLVLASMHTNSAISAIVKLLGFFPQEHREQRAAALASSIVGIICQSLLPTEDGESFVLASEMVFNNNQQVAKFIADPSKLALMGDFMKRREDNMSRCLNDILAQLVAKKTVNVKDAMRATYNRLELHEMINRQR
jgi:twitching motility protein PilT